MKKIIYFLLTTTMILFFSSCTMLYPKGERFQMRFIKAIERKDADYIKKCFRADSNVSDEDVNALLAAYGDSKSTRVTYHAGQYTKNNEYGKVEDIYEVTNEITIDSNTSYRLYYFWYASDFNDNIGISKLWFYTQEKYDLYLPYVAGLSCIDEYDKGLYIIDYNVFFSENHLDCISKVDTFIDSIKTRNDNEFRNLLAPELLNNDTNINIDDLYDYSSNHNKEFLKKHRDYRYYLFYLHDNLNSYFFWNIFSYKYNIKAIYCYSENDNENGIQYLNITKIKDTSKRKIKNELEYRELKKGFYYLNEDISS